MTMIPYIHS